MSKILTTLRDALGLKAKNVSLDVQADAANDIASAAIAGFEQAVQFLDTAARFQQNIAAQYDDLGDRLAVESADAFDAADELALAAANTRARAAKIRDVFGIANPDEVAA